MKNIFLCILICLGAALPASAQLSKNTTRNGFSQFYPASGEAPFPWGSEAPFPWQTIDGLYRTNTAPLYFKFDQIRDDSFTNKYLRVTLLDDSGDTIAQGVGVTRSQDQIIRARVVGDYVDATALVRAYNTRKAGQTCTGASCVMVVTLRGNSASTDHDLHYILGRVPKKKGLKVSPAPMCR